MKRNDQSGENAKSSPDFTPDIGALFGRKPRKPIARSTKPPKRSRIKFKPKADEEREHIQRVREEVWIRDKKRCVDCGKPLPLDGDEFTRMHAAHTVRRWKLGNDYRQVWRKDVLKAKCYDCHSREHNAGGKPCPKKPDAGHGS